MLINAINGIYKYLKNVLYVPKLSINLILAKKLYKSGFKGIFNNKNI